MSKKITQEMIDKDRRGFIDKFLKGSIAGSMFVVIPMGAGDAFHELAGEKENELMKMKPNANYAFIVDITACIGCGNCCVADKKENNVPDGQYRTWVERYVIDMADNVYVDSPNGGLDGFNEPPKETILETIKDAFFVPKLCNHCHHAPCTQVCPVGATFTTPDGFVIVDGTHCVGCGYCIQACPYGVRFLNKNTNTADKCTWCYHRVRKGKMPACVNACPTGARKFGDLNDPNTEVAKIVNSPEILTILKKELGTSPAVHYIGKREEVI